MIGILRILAIISMICLYSSTAMAGPKFFGLFWWGSHWTNLDFEPYLETAKPPHNTQWDSHIWSPADWIAQRSDANDLIRGFYNADILRAQVMDDDVPVLVVGPRFYMLNGEDKRRVAATVDNVYQITSSRLNGMYVLQDWKTDKMIGSYTQYGLQIQ